MLKKPFASVMYRPVREKASWDNESLLLSRVEAFLRERGIDYVTYQVWMMLDQYEVACGTRQGRPHVKITTVPEIKAIIRQGQ